MKKAKHSPVTILLKAMEIYLDEEDTTIEGMLKNTHSELRLKTIAFAMRNLLSYHGYKITTEVENKMIHVSSYGVTIYQIEDKFSSYKTSMSLSFSLVCHWGNIVNILDKIGHMSEKKVIGDTQIALAI